MLQNSWKKDAPIHCGESFVKTVAGVILLSVFCFIQEIYGTTYTTNGSSSDVQAKVNSSVSGDIVTLPAGSFTWTTGVTVTGKAIKIQGAGSGRIIGRSLTSTVVGSGAKTFTTQAGLAITAGQTLRIIRRVVGSGSTDVSGTFMQGTVTSYLGTLLVMNITSIGGTGTYATWIVTTIPQTTVTYTSASNQGLSVTAPTSGGNVEVSGIKFLAPNATGSGGYALQIGNGYPGATIIHDCWFSNLVNAIIVEINTNTGVMYNCSFDSPFSYTEAIRWRQLSDYTSWVTVDTIGDRDTTGLKNFYVEDCDFHFYENALDFDSNSRVVVRYCIWDNAGIGSHGADTGPYGTRHWEIYNNTFVFEPTTNGVVLPMNWYYFCRGGTGVITDNVMPAITSQDYGTKSSINFIVENIRRNAGPYPCWTAYPAPHSVGQGNNGSSGTLLAGDILDPVRIWNNTGTGATNVQVGQYDPDECGKNTQASAFTQLNRDYYVGTARPGYTKYTYPHSLRGGGTPPSAPSDVHIVP